MSNTLTPAQIDLTVEQVNEIYRRNPNRIITELTDVAAWLERTKPQGLLYESAMPTMLDAAQALSEMIFGTALILAALGELRHAATAVSEDVSPNSDGALAASADASVEARLILELRTALASAAR